MPLKFTKMHGSGNDFIVIDATLEKIALSAETIRRLADRRTGIGFDQLLLLEPAPSEHYDFKYRIFNADGGEVEQCGNGARCVAHYVFNQKKINKDQLILATLSGPIELIKTKCDSIKVNMGPPRLSPEALPFITDQQKEIYQLNIAGKRVKFGAVSMGNPHVVIEVSKIETAPVLEIGELLQQHPAFPNQVNVGFMEIVSPTQIRLRVYERGVGETRSCGTGACAAVVIGRLVKHLSCEVTVALAGGNLVVNWLGDDQNVYMTGPAETVFRGELITK